MTRATFRADGRPAVMIIADDLSGATDSAVACAVRGLETVVALGDMSDFGAAEAIAFDADTRRLPAAAAAAETARLVSALAPASNGLLFKKVDSTLRGHLGPEIASLLDTRRRQPGRTPGRRTILVLAPAFPALGRTTMRGSQHLNGVPIENTGLWVREASGRNASLLDMMRGSGLESALVSIETVRAGPDATRDAMADVADRIDVLICDAQMEEDLATIAQASLRIGADVVWAGSAGLIGPLLDAAALSPQRAALPKLVSCAGSLLFVVGSLASISRRQAALLATADVVALTIEDGGSSNALAARFAAAVAAGEDVLLLTTAEASPPVSDASPFFTALRDVIAPHVERIGGLFVTGGETARVVLTGMGVTTLRPVAEVEPGIPLSIAGGPRSFPVITKAGAFGDVATMLTCRRVLHECGSAAFTPALCARVPL